MIDIFLYVDIPMPVVFLEAIFDWFNETYTEIIKWFGGLTLGFSAWFDNFWSRVTYVWDTFQKGLGYIITTVQGWLAFVVDLWLDISVIFWDGVFIAVDYITGFFLPFYDLLAEIWNATIGSISFQGIWGGLQNLSKTALAWFLDNWEYFLLFFGGGLAFLVGRGALVAYSFIAAFLRSPFFLRFAGRFLGKFGKLGALLAAWLALGSATTATVSAVSLARAVIWLLLIGAFTAFMLFVIRGVSESFLFPAFGNLSGEFFAQVFSFAYGNEDTRSRASNPAAWRAWGSHMFSAAFYVVAFDVLIALYIEVWTAIFVLRRVRFVIALS